MDYDFDYFSGRDLRYPGSPAKPGLSYNPTAAEARLYANQLEAYETDLVEYKRLRDDYNRSINGRLHELKTRLRNDYNITEGQVVILWNKAWEDGHSEGVRRVVEIFDELYDVASEFAALE